MSYIYTNISPFLEYMLNTAIEYLKAGELVAFPTETVYGLGADANNIAAVKKVFDAKNRPIDHPLILHIGTIEQLPILARQIPDAAYKLAKTFWPGPLTIILKKQPHVLDIVTASQDTVAIRIPSHPLTLEMLKKFGSAIVGPSANKFGLVSPTTAQHVQEDFSNQIYVLDGGPAKIGIESTIIDLSTNVPNVLRFGAITTKQIEETLEQEISIKAKSNVKTAGQHANHYAPKKPLYILTWDELLNNANQDCSIISFKPRPKNISDKIHWQQEILDPKIYMSNLYSNLRMHDKLNSANILLEQPPNEIEWFAILERLERARFKV